MRTSILNLITGGLLGLTLCSGLALASAKIYADNDSATDNINITVPVACTMTGTIATGQEHTATLQPGTYSGASGSAYENGIGKTTLATYCNDYNGFSIYAIGFTGETEGDNTLVGTSASGSATIPTKVYESTDTTSNWSMKVTKVTDISTTFNPANMSIQGNFDSWHTVPNDYTKVAEYHASTGSSATDTALGAKVETTYASYISSTQPADTYTGKVKYVMVHPYDAATPERVISFDNAYASAGKQKLNGYYTMQDMSDSICDAVSLVDSASVATVIDVRDNNTYKIAKLQDDNCWMLDNMTLDLTDSTTLANVTAENTNASATTLNYLKNGGGTASDQYATSAVSEWSTSPTYSSSYSYSDPLIATSGDCSSYAIQNGWCANDPESGKWTKDSLPPDQNNEHTYYGAGSGKIGIYYNYCAVSAGSYCYGDGSSSAGTPSGEATEDICPANWRMPTGFMGDTEQQNLVDKYGADTPALNADSLQYNLSTPLSGHFAAGVAEAQGFNGNFWSSSFVHETFMDYLFVDSYSSLYGDYVERNSAMSLRCIADY